VALPTEYAVTSIEPQVAEKIPKMEGGRSAVSILLVEDDDAIRKLVELLLQQRSWQVTAVADGVQALESLQSRQFDLALMDIRMPRLDGLETTRRIRRRERILGLPPLPIVGMTAHAAQQDRAMCLEAGMNDHVSKPIASAHLYAIIEKCLAC
jgi:CheY-like chemotaxis protein